MGKKYKLILRFYDDVAEFDEIIVENPDLVKIVSFPATKYSEKEGIAIFEFVPIEEGEK